MAKKNIVDLTQVGIAIALAAAGSYRQPTVKLGSLTRLIDRLLMDPTQSYDDIVRQCKEQFPDCSTTTRSVASIACVHRRKGTQDVPMRMKVAPKQLALI